MERNLTQRQLLLKLFLSTLYISTFTFGGGFVIVTFMKRKFVDELHWLEEQEMLDLTALAQSAPGAIAVNAAMLVGWRVAGWVGMLVAVLGTIIPPLMIISVISVFYASFANNYCVATMLKGMQAGVAAVIVDVVCGLGLQEIRQRSPLHIVIMIAAFILTFCFHINVIFIIIGAAAIGLLSSLKGKRGGQSA